MPKSCLADRLGDMVVLTANERLALEQLEERERNLRRGASLQLENQPTAEMFVLLKGMMMSSVLLDDGSRQILNVHFVGDLLSMSSLVYRGAIETITALSDCTVAPFDRAAFAAMLVEHPRLAGLVLVCNQIERAALTDRLAGLGRTPAKARVAAMLIELRNRLRVLSKGIGTSFILGLTQEEIGDATGLTAVHVNRMLRQLEDEQLIAREGSRVTFTNERELTRAANFVDRYVGLDLSWLPEGR